MPTATKLIIVSKNHRAWKGLLGIIWSNTLLQVPHSGLHRKASRQVLNALIFLYKEVICMRFISCEMSARLFIDKVQNLKTKRKGMLRKETMRLMLDISVRCRKQLLLSVSVNKSKSQTYILQPQTLVFSSVNP